MSCTCVNLTNKNAINRLHPTVDNGSHESSSTIDQTLMHLIYIRGNKYNPIGVVNKLYEYGGVASSNYTSSDLMNEHNLFYIDYNNSKRITFIPDNETLANSILSCWKEVFVTTDITYSPDNWEIAIADYPEAQLYAAGKDEKTNNEIKIVGILKVLRDIYRKGWEPNPEEPFYYIGFRNEILDKGKGNSWKRFLSFQTAQIRDTFYDNYKDLIEKVYTYI